MDVPSRSIGGNGYDKVEILQCTPGLDIMSINNVQYPCSAAPEIPMQSTWNMKSSGFDALHGYGKPNTNGLMAAYFYSPTANGKGSFRANGHGNGSGHAFGNGGGRGGGGGSSPISGNGYQKLSAPQIPFGSRNGLGF